MAKKLKLSTQEVREFVEKKGYRLLSSEYRGARKKIRVSCSEGHEYEVVWYAFQAGASCSTCKRGWKPTTSDIVKIFSKEGYTLLSEYINANTKLKFLCPNGHEHQMTWRKFQEGNRCVHCSHRRPISFCEVQEKFASENYKLLEKEYVNCKSKMKYECPEGHINSTTWTYFRVGHRCPECSKGRTERRVGEILRHIYPNREIVNQDNLGFLGKQSVDFSIPELKIAVEYDGIHHYEPTRFGGISLERAEKRFQLQCQRDLSKEQKCKKEGYSLVRIPYFEEVSVENIRRILERQLEYGN